MYRKYHKAPWFIHGNKLVVLLLYTLKTEIATMDSGNVIIGSDQTVLCLFSTAVMGVFWRFAALTIMTPYCLFGHIRQSFKHPDQKIKNKTELHQVYKS